MSKFKKWTDILEWIVAVLLLFTCIYYYCFNYGSFSAKGAFKESERTYNYGPSKIEKEIDLKNAKIFLARYKDWFSANMVEKKFLKWYPSSGVGGVPINYNEKVTQTWEGSKIGNKTLLFRVYGYVNDPNISEITLDVERNGKTSSLKYNLTSDRLFIFYWDNNTYNYNFIALNGFDKNGQKIYTYEYPH